MNSMSKQEFLGDMPANKTYLVRQAYWWVYTYPGCFAGCVVEIREARRPIYFKCRGCDLKTSSPKGYVGKECPGRSPAEPTPNPAREAPRRKPGKRPADPPAESRLNAPSRPAKPPGKGKPHGTKKRAGNKR